MPSRKELLDTRQDAVVLRLGDRPVEIVLPSFEEPLELVRRRLAVEHRLEGLASDLGVGHPRVGELADVRGDPVELVEGERPRAPARPAGDDERPVDVEQNGDTSLGPAHPRSKRAAWPWPTPTHIVATP
jgi:hypothetical protein